MRFPTLMGGLRRRPLAGASLLGVTACAGALLSGSGVGSATGGQSALAEEAPRRGVASGSHSYADGSARRPPRLIVADPDAFARKWRKFAADGPARLLVISDFDQTLTPFYKRSDTADSPGAAREQESSSHGLLMSSRVVDPAVSAAERELFARYFPIEMSPKLSREEKLPFMIEWWTRAHELLVEHRLTRAQIRQAVAQSRLSFRPGFHALFAQLEAAQIPTLVFSAGLYDVIHEVLAKEFTATANRPVPANVHVVSNMMRFDADGTLEGFQGSLIHSFNKNATVLLDSSFWRQCKIERRSNVLLLGDSRGDVNMAQGLDCTDDEIIRVGFLNVHVDDAIDEYLALYDVVLTHDGSLEPVALLLEQLLAHESHQKPQ